MLSRGRSLTFFAIRDKYIIFISTSGPILYAHTTVLSLIMSSWGLDCDYMYIHRMDKYEHPVD